jgi:GMP synthase-like glutamine amidotransferase
MRVGVVVMCDIGKSGCTTLVNTLLALGHTPLMIFWNHPNLVATIRTSGIDHWIFSGNATYTKDEDMHRMPMAVFSLPIHVFCICYSFQSALVQLGYTLHHKRKRVYKKVSLGGMTVLLNYTQYIPSPVEGELASYGKECMMVRYKNALLTQFHPEATADGRKLLVSFLAQK